MMLNKKYNLKPEEVFKEFIPQTSPPTFFRVEDTPLYKVGMFKKYIHNILYKNPQFKNKVNIKFDSAEEEKEFIINYLYNRAFKIIQEYKSEDEIWENALLYYNYNNELVSSLEHIIQHFEIREEFEKCAFLHKILLNLKDK